MEALVLLRLIIIRLGLGLGTNTQVTQVIINRAKNVVSSGMRTELTPSHLRKSGLARWDARTPLCRDQRLPIAIRVKHSETTKHDDRCGGE